MPANRLPAAIAYPVCIRQLQGKKNDTWCTEAPDEFDKKRNGGVALNHAQSIVALGIFVSRKPRHSGGVQKSLSGEQNSLMC